MTPPRLAFLPIPSLLVGYKSSGLRPPRASASAAFDRDRQVVIRLLDDALEEVEFVPEPDPAPWVTIWGLLGGGKSGALTYLHCIS